ncbi:PREDICTED: vesicle-associated membrane protein 4, partial [Chlamydotis macqueenii]
VPAVGRWVLMHPGDPEVPGAALCRWADGRWFGFFLCLQRNLLDEDSDEEEDFFLRGPSGPRFGPRSDKIRHVQNQVDEVIDVMQENITKVIERGERLDDLQDKSESLSDNATAFSNRAKQLRRQMWWRGCKMKAIIALVAVIVLLVIIVPIVLKYHT